MTDLPQGSSGYFSTPSDTLDPALFDGDHIKSDVRGAILSTLLSWLSSRFGIDSRMVHVWLSGSGISYQWAADRGNGDLDVMYSVYLDLHAPGELHGLGEEGVANLLNTVAKAELWPATSNSNIGGKTYEITFYCNPGNRPTPEGVHAYAAYDLTSGAWIVRPPKLPADPATLYPQSWFDTTQADHDAAAALFSEFVLRCRDDDHPSPVIRANARAYVQRLGSQARALYDDIHLGRHGAFTDQGTGYGDYRNFRWQRAKQLGHAETLRAVIEQAEARGGRAEVRFEGRMINPADVATVRAAQWRSQR